MLEARDRVGGRTWSQRLDNGATVEMGAEFILPGNTEVRALAERARARALGQGHALRRARAARAGSASPRPSSTSGVAAVAAALADARGRPTARELLDSLAIAAGAREAILARPEISSASSGDEVPAVDLAGLAHIDDEPAPSVAGGNQGLSLALAERLGDAVGSATRSRRWRGDRAGSVCDDRGRARGRRPTLRGRGPRERLRPDPVRARRCPPAKVEALAGSATGTRRSCSCRSPSRSRRAP